MKIIVFVICFAVVMFLIPVNSAAQNAIQSYTWEKNCTNSTHLFKWITRINDGVTHHDNQTIFCPNGCEENLGKYGADCVEPDYLVTAWVIGGVLLLFFIILIVLGRRR